MSDTIVSCARYHLNVSAAAIGRTPLALIALAVVVAVQPCQARDNSHTLPAIQSAIQSDYPGVKHMSDAELKQVIGTRPDSTLILDVREASEFAVSRIPGAKRVDPGIWNATFLRKFAHQAKGKTVVFYCSVGVRSTKLADRVRLALKKAGAKTVMNLKGGIFHWSNAQHAMVDGVGSTRMVHPYNNYWGRLLKHRDKISYRPAPRSQIPPNQR